MAGGGLLMLLDDITTLLDDIAVLSKAAASKSAATADDVAVMTKVAMRKTAGVLGDDLALNAEQVTGMRANRELPVVWAVAKGSLLNKAILVPFFLLISAFIPWLITPLLMVGGAFLCFEGVEKIVEMIHRRGGGQGSESAQEKAVALERDMQEAKKAGVVPSSVRATQGRDQDPAAYEKSKVQGAIRTDFILSAEIMAIALGTVATRPLMEQTLVLIAVALAITVFVYGLVACIVRLDDVGEWLKRRPAAALQALGGGLIAFTPWLMRGLSILGTAAMFLVGGSLLVHGMPFLAHWTESAAAGSGAALAFLLPHLVHVAVGAVVGTLVLICVHQWQKHRAEGPGKA